MATRLYFPSSGAAAVTPSTWNFGAQINPVTLAGSRTKSSTAMTTKTEATGTTNPTARGMLRYVYGPLEGQTISGTVKGQMRGAESNTGANASLALAIKIIQPDGTDRAVCLAQTAGDSAAAGVELATSLTNAKFLDAAESATISLTSQAATRGDYLVIEIGFRSATGTTRNIDLRYGDTGSTDLAEDTTTTTDNVPWLEFTDDIAFIDRTPGVGAAVLDGPAPSRVVNHIAAVGLCALSLLGTNVKVAFPGAETGSATLAGAAPTVQVAADSNTTISVPVGSLTLSGLAPALQTDVGTPAGALTLSGQAPAVTAGVGLPVGSLALSGVAPSAVMAHIAATGVGALVLDGPAATADNSGGNPVSIPVPVGALTLAGTNVKVAFVGAETGALTFTGQTPSVNVNAPGSSISVPAGSLVCAGNTPANGLGVGVPAGGLWLFGNNVDQAFAGPTPAALTLNGLAPTIQVAAGGSNTSISPGVGALTLTGAAPDRVVNHIATPGVCALTLTGQAPARVVNHIAATPAGALTLSGQTPARLVNHIAQPSAGALVLSGVAPALNGAQGITPGAGSLALSGLAPSVVAPVALSMGVGALSLSGAAATVPSASTFNPAWAVNANAVVSPFLESE